jgi:hypothetical protein
VLIGSDPRLACTRRECGVAGGRTGGQADRIGLALPPLCRELITRFPRPLLQPCTGLPIARELGLVICTPAAKEPGNSQIVAENSLVPGRTTRFPRITCQIRGGSVRARVRSIVIWRAACLRQTPWIPSFCSHPRGPGRRRRQSGAPFPCSDRFVAVRQSRNHTEIGCSQMAPQVRR